jgi:hypothetical protein
MSLYAEPFQFPCVARVVCFANLAEKIYVRAYVPEPRSGVCRRPAGVSFN